jgi:hypothetical protein
MFRAAHRSSSGALTVFATSGLHTPVVTGRIQVKFPLRLDYGRSPQAYVNQRLQIQLELLMMSGMPLEACWAFNERWNNKFYYKLNLVGYFSWVTLDMLTVSLVCVRKTKNHSPTLCMLVNVIACSVTEVNPRSVTFVLATISPRSSLLWEFRARLHVVFLICWQLRLECLWLCLCLGSLISIWLEVYETREESNTQSK